MMRLPPPLTMYSLSLWALCGRYLGLAICPAALQLVLFALCPESPRYLLISANREEEARVGE